MGRVHFVAADGASVRGDGRERALASNGDRGPGARELFTTQPLSHAPPEEQPVKRALILGEHPMRGTRGESNAHETELACAIASDGVDEIEGFLLASVPDDLHGHDSACPLACLRVLDRRHLACQPVRSSA